MALGRLSCDGGENEADLGEPGVLEPEEGDLELVLDHY
jgi:hypothetical protein